MFHRQRQATGVKWSRDRFHTNFNYVADQTGRSRCGFKRAGAINSVSKSAAQRAKKCNADPGFAGFYLHPFNAGRLDTRGCAEFSGRRHFF